MKRTKALVFDIDGTLIPYKAKAIPIDVVKALNKLAKEYYLFVATGRHILELNDLDGVNFDAYITSDGQVVTTKRGKSFINSIPKHDINNLLKYLNENEVACSFAEKDCYYINFINQKVQNYHEYVIFDVPEVKDISVAKDNDIIVVTVYANEDIVNDILKIMPGCKSINDNQFGSDILNKHSGKGYGLEKICKHFKLDLKDVICFGDSQNDIEMFEICGKSCAMANADMKLKKVATYVSSDANDNGIIKALKHFKLI